MSKTFDLVRKLYLNSEGEPFELTPGQEEIFEIIFKRKYPRTQAMTPTQYGKSDDCGMAVLTRIISHPELWAVVAPTLKKAGIIMGYIIGHIFDNPIITSQFQIGPEESLERIRRDRRKDKLTFRLGKGKIGGVFILSVEGKRIKQVIDAIMGFGAKSIILDESGLISDQHYAGVKRMLGGHKDNFLFEIGNPFRRNHFLRTWRDPLYHHIKIDWKQAVAEGRMTKEFIDEMRREAFFDILYNVNFPEEEAIDTKGFMVLITEKKLDLAYVEDIDLFGELRLGIDSAAGGASKSVIILRGENGAKVEYSERSSDTMALVGNALKIVEREKKEKRTIRPKNVFVDAIGVGKGVLDRLREQLKSNAVVGVIGGEAPEFPEGEGKNFLNRRAQSHWRAVEWINSGGKLKRHPGFEELLDDKYKVQSDRKIKLKSKEELLKEGISSPDHADALALTFHRKKAEYIKKYKQKPYEPVSEYEGK